MEERKEKLEKLSRDVLILSRNTLLVNLRFLDTALSQFEFFPIETSGLLTDGKYILYNPVHILKNYKQAKEIPIRDYLHIVMHCVFRHMYMNPTLSREYWDLACDIAVENIITDLELRAVETFREGKQQSFINSLKKELKFITAEKIYAYLKENYSDPVEIAQLRGLFYADNHEIWYMSADEITITFGLSYSAVSSEDPDGKKNGSNDNNDSEENGNDGSIGQEAPSDTALANAKSALSAAMSQIWSDIAERMQVDMETFGKQKGLTPGSLTQNLKAVTREKYDYTAFLKKFAVMGERMQINDDEFDYIFYTYGLQLYDKMPLIEPLEYKDVKAIKEFVIAIDTSGSVQGDLVQKFIQKTYNILKNEESFFTKINLHIIQCDTKIQEDKKITSQEEFDEYLKTMKLHGFGGTDFRPVFTYVEQLRKNKEFINLKGLIYFTDGFGEFPERKPDYDTAFIFIDDEYNNPDVPPWAIKLVLQKNEI